MTSLSKEAIISQLESDKEFPIDMSDVWEWLGYMTKASAKRSLLGMGFIEGVDLYVEEDPAAEPGAGIQANPKEEIFLTVDCFKLWSMSAQTEKGKEVRIYYLSVEKEWKKTLNQQRDLQAISPDHIAAYNFDRSQFQPWKDSNPIASEIFLTWQNVAPSIASAPVRVDTNFVLPSKEMQSALGDAFLNLNRSGLAMNKLFHFVDRIPTMQKMDSKAFTEMQEALLDAGETIHRLQDGLKDEKSKVAATSRTLKRLEGTIAHLEQQLVNVCQRTTSSPIVPDDVELVPKGDRQKQLKSAKAK